MATLESMAIRSDSAMSRIEAQLARMGIEIGVPRTMREREMLRCIQLEAIAHALEQVVYPVGTPPTPKLRKPRTAKQRRK